MVHPSLHYFCFDMQCNVGINNLQHSKVSQGCSTIPQATSHCCPCAHRMIYRKTIAKQKVAAAAGSSSGRSRSTGQGKARAPERPPTPETSDDDDDDDEFQPDDEDEDQDDEVMSVASEAPDCSDDLSSVNGSPEPHKEEDDTVCAALSHAAAAHARCILLLGRSRCANSRVPSDVCPLTCAAHS